MPYLRRNDPKVRLGNDNTLIPHEGLRLITLLTLHLRSFLCAPRGVSLVSLFAVDKDRTSLARAD